MVWYQTLKIIIKESPPFLKFKNNYSNFSNKLIIVNHIWALILSGIFFYGIYLFYLKNTAQLSPKNVVEAYYDALDFKEFERAHSYLNPENNLSIAQYMLEVSVTDGILSSYAKLNSIDVEVISETKNNAKIIAITEWVTPLEVIDKKYNHELVKKNNQWFINPNSFDLDIPPDQLFSDNIPEFYNHGRRRITTQQTHHEDVLKQPVLEILSASLVKYNNQYSIIGELQNIDNVPADVVLKGTLYSEENKELASFNAKYVIKHKLLPKETTSFRVDFEGIAWLDPNEKVPETFNPHEFTPISLEEQPTKFNLQCAGNVATTDLYKKVAVTNLDIGEKTINGTLFNYGIQEVTIPQLLVSYYNSNKEIVWVEHQFLREGVRIQRKQTFNYPLQLNDSLQVINNSLENCFVNGLPNKSIAKKVVPLRKVDHLNEQVQPLDNSTDFKYFKIELNNYIGNPN